MNNLEKYGYNPVQYKVLLRQKKLDDKYESDSVIIRPDNQTETEQWAEPLMEILAVGGAAFKDWITSELNPDAVIPKVGDWVITRPYSGFKVMNGDEEYKIATDGDIMAITEAPK